MNFNPRFEPQPQHGLTAYHFIQKFIKYKRITEAKAFNFTFRHVDDVLSINNPNIANLILLIIPYLPQVWYQSIYTTPQVTLVEQELLTLPEHLSSSPVFSGVRVTQSSVLFVCFVNIVCPFFFWPWYYLSFVLRILITPLVSSSIWQKRRLQVCHTNHFLVILNFYFTTHILRSSLQFICRLSIRIELCCMFCLSDESIEGLILACIALSHTRQQ